MIARDLKARHRNANTNHRLQTPPDRLSSDILTAPPFGPPHCPLVQWSTNISRGDNPVTGFLFEAITPDS
ncbi:hypothetical protein V496_01446 [Pseudogymnoascus sp. VKM F-4515 (FW-2607)]|nr:hypothetical protein V496_01446 [Pseudogymnoascus sp. VKM F-4515 (FW-2607)]